MLVVNTGIVIIMTNLQKTVFQHGTNTGTNWTNWTRLAEVWRSVVYMGELPRWHHTV